MGTQRSKLSQTSEHDPEKACPGLNPGWKPVFRKDYAPPNIRASKGTQSEEVALEGWNRPNSLRRLSPGSRIATPVPTGLGRGGRVDRRVTADLMFGRLRFWSDRFRLFGKKSQMVRRDFSRAVPETTA
jgi:hypothetical protein